VAAVARLTGVNSGAPAPRPIKLPVDVNTDDSTAARGYADLTTNPTAASICT
jgi:hypothetical protein